MEITEVRVKLMEDGSDRLKAFCSITFDDCFVIRDLKIIEGTNGPFVAMPSRKLTSHCPECGCKNHLRADFCNQCGLSCRKTVRAATTKAVPSCTPTLPIRSMPFAGSVSREAWLRLSRKNWNFQNNLDTSPLKWKLTMIIDDPWF